MKTAQLEHPARNAKLYLTCNASDTGLRAVLQQEKDSSMESLGFFSRVFSLTELNYSTYDRKFLAIFTAICHFRPVLEGSNFTVLTHHKPLTHALKHLSSTTCPRRIRQLNFISQFTLDIQYQSGGGNVGADAIPRIDEVYVLNNY